jgi:SAM-dependent methyltransferase
VTPAFKDYFSAQAAAYAAFRPHYPPALFEYLASLSDRRDVAWDCATGSGQAALGLAAHFARVIATDASAEQIAQAAAHHRVEYHVAAAECSALPAGAVDLVTAAQALHWFDVPAFYREVRRVLAPGGTLAVWCYGNPSLPEPALDRVLREFTEGTLGEYWPPERRLVLAGYRTIAFPFEEIAVPAFTLEARATLSTFVGYLRTWSGTRRYVEARGADPIPQVEAELRRHWGDPDRQLVVRWPLRMRAGRVGGSVS